MGSSSTSRFTTTLVTDAGDVSVRTRDVLVDSGPDDGPVTGLIAQLVSVGRAEREAELRARVTVLGLDVTAIDAFFGEAVQARSAGSNDTLPKVLRGGTTAGGSIEVVLRYHPDDDTVFTNLQGTWLS